MSESWIEIDSTWTRPGTVTRYTREAIDLSPAAAALYRRCADKVWREYAVYLGDPDDPEDDPEHYDPEVVAELVRAGLFGPPEERGGYRSWPVFLPTRVRT